MTSQKSRSFEPSGPDHRPESSAQKGSRKGVRRLLASTLAILAFIVLAPARPAAASTTVPTPAPYPTVAPPSELADDGTGTASPLASCAFLTDGDWVHLSGADVSGHGWWINVNCSSDTRATVKIWLEEYYNDGVWRVKASGEKSPVYAGGGSANRAAARVTCNNNSAVVSWRSRIDVDIIGQIDSPEQLITQARNLACVVL